MKNYKSFLEALGFRESGGNYSIQNYAGFAGKYQMGEAALIDAGYYKPDGTKSNDWKGTWTGKDGIKSIDEFLMSRVAQENAIVAYMDKQWSYIQHHGLDKYIGKTLSDGTIVTESGLLAGAHLKGIRGLINYIKSDGVDDNVDGLGTKISSYVKKFGGYDIDTGATPSQGVNFEASTRTYTWGTQSSWLATTDDPAGFYKAGDQIIGTYDNNKNLISADINRKDGSQAQLTYSADRTKAYYTEWLTEQGVDAKSTQVEFDVGANGALTRAAKPFLYKGYEYDASGNPVPVDGHTAPTAVNPTLPDSAMPTAAQSESNAINGLGLDNYGIDPSGVTLPSDLANQLMPSGNASDLIADLRARGYTVSADEDGIFAQKGGSYLFLGDGYMQAGDGTNLATVELRGNQLVVTKALITSDTESTRSTQTFTLQGVPTGSSIEVTNGSIVETTQKNAAGDISSRSSTQTFDDGSSLETTTLPNGTSTTRAFDTEGTLSTSQTTKVNPSTNQTQQTVLVQVDDDGNTLITTTNANGSGTMQVLDSEGNVIGQASFQRTHNGVGAMDGDTGTVTALVGGNNVTYAAAFDDDFGLVSFDGSGGSGEGESDSGTTLGQVSLLGVNAIGGQAVNYSPVNASMAAADLDLADLWAYGGYSTNTDGTTSTTPTLQASYELQQATATANPNLKGQSQIVSVPVAAAGNPSVFAQLNKWAEDHADFTQGLNGAMTLLRGIQTNNRISITTGAFDLAQSFASGGAGRPHGDWLVGWGTLNAANDMGWRVVA